MNSARDARWQALDALLDRLFDASPQAREVILQEVDIEDAELARSARRLLAAAERDDLEPGGALVSLLPGTTDAPMSTSVLGKRVGPWRLIRELGHGGMGRVYLAERAEGGFEQQAALKLLSTGSHSNDLLRRFEQERRILARLDHPHIARLLDGGVTAEGRPWFAMELVDGVRIDHYCDQRNLSVEGRLRLFSTVTDAVHAAHQRRVIHRDLKPSNILVTPTGEVKLLDFGIARLLDAERQSADATRTLQRMLTPSYATPEQIRGESLTTASDVYQLGLLLYELLTGRRAHQLEETTPQAIERAVCETPPTRPSLVVHEHTAPGADGEGTEALAATRSTTPAHLDRRLRGDLDAIVMMAIRKEPRRRYPAAADLVGDIERHIGGRPVRARPESWRYRSGRFLSRHRLGVAATASAGLAVAAALLAGILAVEQGRFGRSADPFERFRVRKLTPLGNHHSVALAPDGRRVVFSEIEGGRQRLRLLRVDTGRVQDVPLPAGYRLFSLTFAPDAQSVYFVSDPPEAADAPPVLYRLALSGGTPVPVLTEMRAEVNVAIDPGRQRVAFVRTDAARGDSRLILADLETGAERVVAVRSAREPYSFPAFSPDGRSVALSVGSVEPYADQSWPVIVDVTDGTEQASVDERWQYVAGKTWLPEGRGIVFVARKSGGENQLWLLSPGERSARQLTQGPFQITGAPSLDARGRSLVALHSEFLGSLWVAPGGRASRARRLTAARGYPAFLYDGQIVFRGSGDLRRIRADGSRDIRLPTGGHVLDMRTSSDGRWIVFSASRSGPVHVWRAAADGSGKQQLTRGGGEKFAGISPDGRWVVYVTVPEFTLWRLDVDRGVPEELLGPHVIDPVISPDGKWIACRYKPEATAPWRVVVLPATGGPVDRTLPIRGRGVFSWSPDGKALDYVGQDARAANLWRLPLAGGDPVQLTDFDSERIHGFAWSKDGAQLAVVRGAWKSQLLLLQELQ